MDHSQCGYLKLFRVSKGTTLMLSHIFLGTNNFNQAFKFYSAIMSELGLQLRFCDTEKPWAAWVSPSAPRPLFLIGKPYDGNIATTGNGQMVALLAPSRDAVDRAYKQALAHGGSSEGAPGLRPEYHANYYGAYFRDVDGNKICVCCHDAIAEL
jgi:catechol 2,3-dioxygenase-like lactoylglutathione lyase family enzyme